MSSLSSCFENIYYHCKLLSVTNRFLCKGRLHHCNISLKGKDNTLIIEKGCSLRHVTIDISGNDNVVHIRHGAYFKDGGRIKVKNSGNQLFINKRAIVKNATFLLEDANRKIIIGEKSLISADVVVRTGDSHPIYNAHGDRVNPGADVVIGNRVWVGAGSTILKGSVIGDDSVIETQSVVDGITIPANSVATGNRAVVVKSGCNWTL